MNPTSHIVQPPAPRGLPVRLSRFAEAAFPISLRMRPVLHLPGRGLLNRPYLSAFCQPDCRHHSRSLVAQQTLAGQRVLTGRVAAVLISLIAALYPAPAALAEESVGSVSPGQSVGSATGEPVIEAGPAGSSAVAALDFGPLSLDAIESLPPTVQPVDRVIVRKSDRTLLLMSRETPVRVYRVALGDSPNGAKRFEGDQRTPEGEYVLDWRNPFSRFYKSIHVSYPNEQDASYAQSLGYSAGGMIMIHGWPEDDPVNWPLEQLTGTDWTDGCIAVSNDAMDEIWALVADGTPIQILP